jgi:hypothetical protein
MQAIVQTKEGFAEVQAAPIAEPRYPEISDLIIF